MIKAEVISHEGNPGPNWLDHCKSAITPWSATAAVILAAVVLTFVVVNHRDSAGQASQQPSSRQSGSVNSIKVKPLVSVDSVQTPAQTSVQAASGANAGASPTNAASILGADDTPTLNTAATPAQTNNSTGQSDPTQSTGQSLTKNVQSTLNAAPKVQSAVTNTLKKLGGLLGSSN